MARGDTVDAAEGVGELERVGEAEFLGDALDEGLGHLEALGGVAHFELDNVLPGALVVEAFEEAAEVSGVDVAVGGDVGEAGGDAVMGFDVAAAALVGFEGFGADGAQRDGGFGDAQKELLEEESADAFLVGGPAEAGVDEVFVEAEDLFRGGGLDDLAGDGECTGEELCGLFALEIDEVFDEGAGGVAGDGVGNAGAVGEERAGGEVVWLAEELDAALTAGDKFDRHVGEIFSAELVVGGAVFNSAADDGDGVGGAGREVEEEAAGFGDLGGEEGRGGGGDGCCSGSFSGEGRHGSSVSSRRQNGGAVCVIDARGLILSWRGGCRCGRGRRGGRRAL